MLVRRIARPLLASTFIQGGIDALRHPESKAPSAEKLDIIHKPGMDKLNITSTEQAVKVNGAIQVVAGTLLSLNKFPRLSALALAGSIVPTTLAGHRFWEEDDPQRRTSHQIHFFKNASMLGGLLLASVDTEGKDSLRRRTQRVSRRSQHRAAEVAALASAASARAAAKERAESATSAAKERAKLAGSAAKDHTKAATGVAKKQAGRLGDLLPA